MNFDEGVAVSEVEKVGRRNSEKAGGVPNFAIRNGSWKLIVPKRSSDDTVDMLFDLGIDPYVSLIRTLRIDFNAK